MYEKNYTDYVLSDGDNISTDGDNISTDTATIGDANYDDFKEDIEQCFYNAIDRYFSDHPIIVPDNNFNYDLGSANDALQYASSTDAKLYTVTVAGDGATSSPQQATAYLLELRNLFLIFVLCWFAITCYSKIKNLIINYTTKN